MTAFYELFAAVYDKLIGDETIKKLVYKPKTGKMTRDYAGVYDSVPDNAPFPYIVIGEPLETDFGVKLKTTYETSLTIHTWSDKAGKTESFALIEAVSNALAASLFVENYRVEDMKVTTRRIFDDIDGVLRHGVYTVEYTLTKRG